MMARLMLVTGAALALGMSQASAEDAVAAGEKRYKKNCITCHGKKGKGLASFPPLKGRDAEYIADRLKKYRAREKVGPNSVIMMEWAAKLSDDEITNIAAYVSTTFK